MLRVTNKMIADRSLHNLQSVLRRMETVNQQLSTGKRVSRPSDDPTAVEVAMRLESTLVETKQYIANADKGITWLNTADAAFHHASSVLQRGRELAQYGANGALSQEDRLALAREVEQLVHDLVQVGNTKLGDKYLFAGVNTQSPPFVAVGDPITSVTYQGSSMQPDPSAPYPELWGRHIPVGPGTSMNVSVTGDVALLPAMEALIEVGRHLRDPAQTDKLGNEDLAKLDDAIDTLLRWRAEVGAKSNRLELVRERLQETELNLTNLLSKTVDVDVPRAIMELKQEESVYRLALASSARIIQPTLLDFLR